MMIHRQRRIRKRQICKRKKTTTTIPATTPTPTPTPTTTTTTLPCLPNDIIFFHILTKLPVRCLLRFNSVSKLWYNTIHHPNFHASHFTHAKSNPSLVSMQPSKYACVSFLQLLEGDGHHQHPNPYMTTIASLELQSDARVAMGTFNGLTCNLFDYTLQISNPSTRELLEFPRPKPTTKMQRKAITCYGFGFDPLRNEYKVIQIWLDLDEYYDIWVYTLGTNKWRNITTTCNYEPDCPPIDLVPVCISGTFFWRSKWHNKILSFDLHHENFQVITVPEFPPGSRHHALFEFEGCLGVVYRLIVFLKDEVELTVYKLKDHHHLPFWHTEQQQASSSSSSSGARWIRSVGDICLPMERDIKLRCVEFAKHIYLHWRTKDGYFMLWDINRKRLIHNKFFGLYPSKVVLLVNHVESLLSLKTFVPPSVSAGEVEVKYLSSREARHESPAAPDHHQQGERKRKKRRKSIFDSNGHVTVPCWTSTIL